MARLYVLGGINVDLVVRGVSLPAPGETVVGGRFEQYHGGKGGNQAVAASRWLRTGPLEGRVAILGAVGDDEMGRAARAALEAEGIDCSGVEVSSQATGVALIVVGPDGENQIAVAPGANATLGGDTGVPGALAADDVLLASLEVPVETVLAATRRARANGARVVVNPAPAGAFDRGLLELADVLVPNEAELAALETAGEGHRGALVVTRGRRGVRLVESSRMVEIAARPVAAVDTTGAGDTFCGVLAACLLEGQPLREAVERANAAASLAVTRPGAREGMPTRGELEDALGRD